MTSEEDFFPIPLTPETEVLRHPHTDGRRTCSEPRCEVRLATGLLCARHLAARQEPVLSGREGELLEQTYRGKEH